MTVADRLHEQLQAGQWLPAGAAVLVAVSGGLDSVVLLDLLVKLQPRWNWELTVAHFEHDWRDESEVAFVVRLATAYGLPCHVRRLAARPAAAARGRGYEEAARHVRYEALHDIARTVGAAAVVTGHHRDDQAETVLYRLVRGTSPGGLAAIAPERPFVPGGRVRLVRPLLAFGRDELAGEARRHGLMWREDASNDDPRFVRNRLRHEALPLLEQIRPGAARQLAELAEWARRDEAYWRQQLQALPADWLQPEPDGGVSIAIALLEQLPEPLRRRCLERLLQQAGVADVTGRHLLQLEALCSHPRPSAATHLPGGWQAWREYGRLCLAPPRAAAAHATVPSPVRLRAGQIVAWAGGRLTVVWQADPPPLLPRSAQQPAAAMQAGRRQPATAVAWLSAGRVPLGTGLVVRSRRDGDRLHPAGGAGTKKLQDLFTGAKVPQRWRDQWPLVCRTDTGDIVWVVGLAVNSAYAASPDNTGHVELRWEHGAETS